MIPTRDPTHAQHQHRQTVANYNNNSVSPLQRRAKEQQLKLNASVQDPNFQLRNAPKGIIANRVRQSLEFKSSLHSYDYQRERQLFGKTLKDDVIQQSAFAANKALLKTH